MLYIGVMTAYVQGYKQGTFGGPDNETIHAVDIATAENTYGTVHYTTRCGIKSAGVFSGGDWPWASVLYVASCTRCAEGVEAEEAKAAGKVRYWVMPGDTSKTIHTKRVCRSGWSGRRPKWFTTEEAATMRHCPCEAR